MDYESGSRTRRLHAIKIVLGILRILAFAAAALFVLVLAATMANGAEVPAGLKTQREIDDPPRALVAFVLALLLSIVAAVVVAVIAARLLRIVAALQAGDPFAAENGTHLRVIGGGLGVFVAAYITSKSVIQWQVPTAHGVDWLAIAPAIAAALLMFVLAEVFREGARMREDLEGTV